MNNTTYGTDFMVRPAINGLFGSVEAPPSKSVTHRAYILASLASEESSIIHPSRCLDTERTRDCLEKLGARFFEEGRDMRISPMPRTVGNVVRFFGSSERVELNCGASGSTLRFLLPLVCALGARASITGDERLFERPVSGLVGALNDMGARISFDGQSMLKIAPSRLALSTARIRADVSSQYISGLLMALPVAFKEQRAEIKLDGERVSENYVTLTLNMLNEYGVSVEKQSDGYVLCAPDGYRRRKPFKAEGDWSSAAVLLAAGALCSNEGVTVTGLNLSSAQPDMAIIDILKRMGARVETDAETGSVTVRRSESGKLKPIMDLSVRDFPDLAAVIVPLMARADGVSRIINAGGLRQKECDRLEALTDMLQGLGITAIEGPDSLAVTGTAQEIGDSLTSTVDVAFTKGDHRMAFAAALLGISGKAGIIAYGGECIEKSYPQFYQALNSLVTEGENVVSLRK